MGDPKKEENPAENPAERESDEDGDMSDVVEVIDIDPLSAEDVEDDMYEMDIEEDGDGDDEDEDEMGPSAPREDADLVFQQHTGSIFCVDVDLSNDLCVSGGEDDKAFVWNIHDGEHLFECTGHKDSVTCASFSHDSTFVATADMSGIISVWEVKSGKKVWSFEVGDLEWIEWHHSAHVLLAGTTEGEVWMWKIPGGDTKTFQSHGCTCNTSKIMPDGKRACAGYRDGSIKIWDLKTSTPIHSVTGGMTHKDAITSMSCHVDNVLVLTGSTDVTAKLTNTQTGKIVTTFSCASSSSTASSGEQNDSVEAVAFSSQPNLMATGTLNGKMTIWDIPSQTARHQCSHDAGIVRLHWSTSSHMLYTATLDGSINIWDGRSGERVHQMFGHTDEILDMAITRDQKHIVTGSGDGTSRVFTLDAAYR